ncbi:ATP-binding cassette domain-containing protein [Paenibacillus sp. LHD-117]|uniref:ATP-binding cassette domain-containing protein n=1 Tax=Paenibacillus sp. LHD-117 TaxID=3071412 RepID=UPI0027E04A41|nr:ATP-binding cassette domain-containing protein [Paenibacillus sp. LHD-117]MDQ6419168.1 ATP-binding cassette domain-containing protein [Paenibacillus sp. LHD-117]
MTASWTLENVSVPAEDRSKLLLRNVNAEFRTGQITLIIGANGAGKSTLLETIAGLRRLESGGIWLGEDSLWLPKRTKRLNCGVLLRFGIAMQQSEAQWFASSAREELQYSLRPYELSESERERRIASAIEQAGLQLTVLERDPWTLSGGQQRRLALACLLACEPEWLLLDEPTAGLDAGGKAALCAMLETYRASGRGAIVVTHDLDALLPLADAVMAVDNGNVRQAKPEEIRRREEPRKLALRLARQLKERRHTSHEKLLSFDDGIVRSAEERSEERQTAESPRNAWLQPRTFDPRAVVLSYLLLSTCILVQNGMLKLALSSAFVTAAVAPFWPLFRSWMPVIRGYTLIAVILVAIGGLSLQPLSVEWDQMEAPAIRLGQLLLVMVLGMPILGLMTPLRLQRALDQTFGWLAKLSVPVQSFTLLVTLIFRFIPLLMREWGRFAKLARARGKETAPNGAFPAKQIKFMLIPYMRAILRLAEEMADALEARGFGVQRQVPVYGFRLKPGCADAWLLGAALAGCAVPLLIDWIF